MLPDRGHALRDGRECQAVPALLWHNTRSCTQRFQQKTFFIDFFRSCAQRPVNRRRIPFPVSMTNEPCTIPFGTETYHVRRDVSCVQATPWRTDRKMLSFDPGSLYTPHFPSFLFRTALICFTSINFFSSSTTDEMIFFFYRLSDTRKGENIVEIFFNISKPTSAAGDRKGKRKQTNRTVYYTHIHKTYEAAASTVFLYSV